MVGEAYSVFLEDAASVASSLEQQVLTVRCTYYITDRLISVKKSDTKILYQNKSYYPLDIETRL